MSYKRPLTMSMPTSKPMRDKRGSDRITQSQHRGRSDSQASSGEDQVRIDRVHAQQCVEKNLKAMLQESRIPFGRTHNLESLLTPLLGQYPKWSAMRPGLRELTAYAVETRYPGESSDKEMARQALVQCRRARVLLRVGLRLGE